MQKVIIIYSKLIFYRILFNKIEICCFNYYNNGDSCKGILKNVYVNKKDKI